MKKSILITEDDKEMHIAYKEMLGDKYDLVFVTNAKDTLKKLDGHTFDLMILDIIMPGESGDAFFERIKGNARYDKLKTLVISVLGDQEDFFKRIDPKSESLTKPVDRQKLLQVVEKMIGK